MGRNREEARLSRLKKLHIYLAIQEEHEEHKYPISALCNLGKITRAAYYKWRNRQRPATEQENRLIAEKVEAIHKAYPDKGYRRIRDDMERYYGMHLNDKRVLRICREANIKSTMKYRSRGCTRRASTPQFIAENILGRDFTAGTPNEKWLTDVTKFKYYLGNEVHKIYLSVILDLYDRRIVSFVIRDRNDNSLVFDTFKQAIASHPEAIHYFIATEDTNIRTERFMQN